MGPFDCTLVLKSSQVPAPEGALFWPVGRLRLVLLFETLTDRVVVRAVDPDVTDRSVLVFRVDNLPPGQRDRFVQAVHDGIEPTLISPPSVSNENRDPAAAAPVARKPGSSPVGKALVGEGENTAIVITDPSGPGQGPKLYLLELSSSSARATGTRG